MTEITLYNTKTRKKERFEPLNPENVRMYVCGPTVYDRAHLGNARPVVVFDVLYRLLRHVYGPEHVTYVRNFTDVDDKINARAKENVGEGGDVNAEIARLTAQTTQWFLDDMGALGALEPSIKDDPDHQKAMPRATQYIPQMIAMIEGLIDKGHAYAAEGHVLFAVDSWKERYGNLSGRSVDDMIAGARVEVAPYKRNPMDFVLWKPSSDDLPGWESPWGRGRPGWHIECSAMSYELLGESFDIHGGGNDLMFPHHENEIAQSCCAHPEGEFARVWMHNEMLQVEGKKMSKSLGNFFTVHDLLEEYDREFGIQNVGPAIRLRFLQSHYRAPVDAARSYIEAAATKLSGWWYWSHHLVDNLPSEQERRAILRGSRFLASLCDDLNTPLAIAEIDRLVQSLKALPANGSVINDFADSQEDTAKRVVTYIEFLGFSFAELEFLSPSRVQERLRQSKLSDGAVESLILELLEMRVEARKNKDFTPADEIRDGFKEAGVVLKDTAEGSTWELTPDFDPAKLEALK